MNMYSLGSCVVITVLFVIAVGLGACSNESSSSSGPSTSAQEPSASAEPSPEKQVPAEPTEAPTPEEATGPSPTDAMNKLKQLTEETSASDVEDLLRAAMASPDDCSECVDTVMKVGQEHKVPRVREAAVASLGKANARMGDVCTYWSDRFKSRTGRDSGASGRALDLINNSGDKCATTFDDVVTEIEGRFAAHKEYGALTSAHLLYVKRFMEQNKHMSTEQRGRVIKAASKLASESEEGRPIQRMAKEISELSAESPQ